MAHAVLPAITGWPPRTRWPDAVHRGLPAVRAVVNGPGAGDSGPLVLGVSGGADSLALLVLVALAGASERAEVLSVDHGVQEGSAAVSAAVVEVARTVRFARADAVRVTMPGSGPSAVGAGHEGEPLAVQDGPGTTLGGPEASARAARYAALVARVSESAGGVVLTAHTADDQAEQVLLGLARGSGPRSLAGIPARGPAPTGAGAGVDVVRPLLGLTRQDTEAICRWAGITWWSDPHNTVTDYRRVRVRQHLLPALEDPERGLGPGVRDALVRTAQIAAEDAAALEAWAGRVFEDARCDSCGDGVVQADSQFERPLADAAARMPGGGEHTGVVLRLDVVRGQPPAVRHRVYALAVRAAGGASPTRERLLAVDGLAATPSGTGTGGSAGPLQLEGGVSVWRRHRGPEHQARTRRYATLEFTRTRGR
ncbi:MAG: tRNA lysidine(34) synthetase TilS [Micrococcus sp.]|nr:tRNA lysidine(34) synthetase TilS [Micrococcus sp.]